MGSCMAKKPFCLATGQRDVHSAGRSRIHLVRKIMHIRHFAIGEMLAAQGSRFKTMAQRIALA